MIAQNVLELVEDHDGHYSERLKKIPDHRREGNAVPKGKMYMATREGQKKLRRSTVGWKFLVEYSHNDKKWMQLSDLKETNLWMLLSMSLLGSWRMKLHSNGGFHIR